MKIFDISYCQTSLDWDVIVNEGCDGVIIKIGETVNGPELDDLFESHIKNAEAHGLKIGFYYFSHAHSEEDAEAEAQFVNDSLYTYYKDKEPELGIWLDVESESSAVPEATVYLVDFINKLRSCSFECQIGLYTGYSFIKNNFDLDFMAKYKVPVWISQYNSTNDIVDEYPDLNVLIWQYTNHYSDDIPVDASVTCDKGE